MRITARKGNLVHNHPEYDNFIDLHYLLIHISLNYSEPVFKNNYSSLLSLIVPGEVKVELAEFDVKFWDNKLCTFFFEIFQQKPVASYFT
jgi:hypothetical protein